MILRLVIGVTFAAGVVWGWVANDLMTARPASYLGDLSDPIVVPDPGVRLVPVNTHLRPEDAAPHHWPNEHAGCVSGPRDCEPYVAPVPLPPGLWITFSALAALWVVGRQK